MGVPTGFIRVINWFGYKKGYKKFELSGGDVMNLTLNLN
jgi:hypothetical protein